MSKQMTMSRLRIRAITLPVVLAFMCSLFASPVLASDSVAQLEQEVSEHVKAAASTDEGSKFANFADKWLVNGNAIGNSIGAVVGQSLIGLAFGGPVGLFLGSVIGSTVGGYLGNMVDDRVGLAINYTAFNRPPVTQGGLWLEGVGPWEQFLYQFDAYVLNGGAIAGIGANLLLNTMARTIPGMGALANPIILVLASYFAGTLADNVDGMLDLGLVGRRIDVARGQGPTVGTTDPSYGDDVDGTPAEIHEEFDSSYEEVLYHLRHGTVDSVRNAYDEFSTVSQSAVDVIESHIEKARNKEL
jgi:uncharacterized protein YcfJ